MTMLDRMRRHKNWLKWSLAFVVLTFVLLYIPEFLPQTTTGVGAAPSEVIAEVDGRPLTAGEFQQRYALQVQSYRAQLGAAASDQLLRQLGIDQQILSQMIEEEVGLIEAARHGITVSDDELRQQIFAIPGLQENGVFIGRDRYEQLLLAQNPPLTTRQFEESLRRSMVLDKLRAALTDWIAVSDAEVDREFIERNEKVRLQVVAVTADSFRPGITVSDDEVAGYFEEHKAEYRVGEQRKVRYLLIDRDLTRQNVIVPATDVQRYYNDNLSLYQTPEQVRASHILLQTAGKDPAEVRARAEQILQQVRGGADFADLARQVSEDEGSKANGGDLDFFGRGQMVPEFETAAFALEVDQVSELVQSQFGFHIIKVTEKRAGSTRTIDEVRPQIQEIVATQIADRQVSDRAVEWAARIDDAGDLDAVAADAGLTVQESGFFQREDPVPGLGVAPQVAATAFTLTGDTASAPLSSPRGPVFIAVSETKDPYVPELDEVRDRVREDLVQSRAQALARERGEAIAAALASARDFAAAAKAQGLEAKDTELITRGTALPDIGVSRQVEQVAFGLPVGGVSGLIETADGTAVVRVAERDEVTADELRVAREAFRAELVAERRGLFFASYMTKAREGLNIEVKADVMQRLLAAYET